MKLLTVEDEVDTGKLLPCLVENSGKRAEHDLVVSGPEAVQVRALAQVLFLLERGADVLKFDLDLGVVNGERSEARERYCGVGIATLLDQPTRSLRRAGSATTATEDMDQPRTSGSQNMPTNKIAAQMN